ncbi:MAG: protein translocase subunit SecF [Actinobacteria bacterium]|nr:protein translocase subunit SecF [Actinomycetota bacterium]NBO06793.1 protein translocase subunit SecF [Actinomycetota bacterium]NBO47505.1 protein translocase subunit SecF [Actinomycetota bacterium]NBP22073.1 protein translocase subunit SecF [Actinomycetota bacterium]NBQ00814.1 protein translocase subunit SecF [Actinomycetota bacterium]
MKITGLGGRLYRGETSVNVIRARKKWYAVSAIFMALSVFALGAQGLRLGIEFEGGSAFVVSTSTGTVEQARQAVSEAGYRDNAIIQTLGEEKIRIQTGVLEPLQSNAIQDALAAKFGVSVESIDTQNVGPSWGEEISKKALQGLIAFLICIMIYLALTFEPKMAVAAVVALIHDVLITVGLYAFIGFEVTPATVIGFLTILGYSLYDTVVVFDKIRENTKGITSTGKSTYSDATNLAVNQTFVRSLNTSLIALLPVAAILFVGAGLLGAGTLKDLALALFIGLIAGTYSSIFIAPPVLASLREREPAMKALSVRVAARGGSTASPLLSNRKGKKKKRNK